MESRLIADYYESLFQRRRSYGASPAAAGLAVANQYLDGKPVKRGKIRIGPAERDRAFWNSGFIDMLPVEVIESETWVLVLTRYLSQEQSSHFSQLERAARKAPESVRRAFRRSGLVLRPDSDRFREIEQIAAKLPSEFDELIRIGHVFVNAHQERLAELERCLNPLAKLTPLELLVYISLYGCDYLTRRVVDLLEQRPVAPGCDIEDQQQRFAINDILAWKLKTTAADGFHLTESKLSRSLRDHLIPFLFPSAGQVCRSDLYWAFERAVAAQRELNDFLSRSVEAFCYDESIRFVFEHGSLSIVEHDPETRRRWFRNGERLERLGRYWLYRAFQEFVESGLVFQPIGRPENADENRLAVLKALATRLQLTEVFGLEPTLTLEGGARLNLDQALRSLALMSAFFIKEFVRPYAEFLRLSGDWRLALGRLALGGLLGSPSPGQFDNRFPLTWSEKHEKIRSIQTWTVSAECPQGNAKAAEAILDFWTYDLRAQSGTLAVGQPGLIPQLHERPILKIGRYLFQVPWLVATQNNTTAAINNLRRLGARRADARAETERIERRLAGMFENRGFRVVLNWVPPQETDEDAGEVDVIAARDGQILVLEVKSTFLRHSIKEAWLHRVSTLRRAGAQLGRKLAAVRAALAEAEGLSAALGLNGPASGVRGWIVDTSIEHDHEQFSGFLKVSLEEILIALRDERDLLNDPYGLFNGEWAKTMTEDFTPTTRTTLYPVGFTAMTFIQVIEEQRVWNGPAS